MYRWTCAEDAGQEIGFIYTTLLSALIMSAVAVSVGRATSGNRLNTAQEEVAQVLHQVLLAIEDLLETVRAYPDATVELRIPVEPHGVQYRVVGTGSGVKVVSVFPQGAVARSTLALAPATAVEGSVASTTTYILVSYDQETHTVRLSAG